jgi:hypothetical protein
MATGTVKSFMDGVLVIKDATGEDPENYITIAMGEGGLRFTINTPKRVKKDRGALDHVLNGEEEPLEWSIEADFRGMVGAANTTNANTLIYEALHAISSGSDWASDEPSSNTHAVNIQLTITDPGDATAEIITLPRSFCETFEVAEGAEGNTLVASGRSMVVHPVIT